MMNLQIPATTALLASPTIPDENLTVKLRVGSTLEPHARSLLAQLTHVMPIFGAGRRRFS